jgi:TatD DNase family protein
LNVPIVDTHCHLNFDRFDPDRPDVIARARRAGLVAILNPGVDLPSSRAAVRLAGQYNEVFAAIGVHPNDAYTWTTEAPEEIKALAQNPRVVAIGEIGLDYYREWTPQGLQRELFRQQLEIATDVGLPVVIHSRNASEEDRRALTDVLQILKEWQTELLSRNPMLAENPGVLHSFSGNLDEARQATEIRFRIGITGPVTFRKADELRQVVESLPLERILIETDAPFLTPQPYRGQRNEPAYVRFVAERIAQLHNLPFEHVAKITTANAERLFHWQTSN